MAKIALFVFMIFFYCKSGTGAENVCSLPIEIGPCRAAVERYAFDSKKQQCVKFVYGGCLGNLNNFETLKECQIKCSKESKNICSLNLETGICDAYFVRYGFDTSLKRCRDFVYGGCRGNANNFLSLEECKIACPAPTPY